jgi:hypothetical protein
LASHRAIHPRDDQVVVKIPGTDDYAIAYPINEKCPLGVSCPCFDIIKFIDEKTKQNMTKKVTKCRFTKGHVACQARTNCKSRLKCEWFHTPAEEFWFSIWNAQDAIAAKQAVENRRIFNQQLPYLDAIIDMYNAKSGYDPCAWEVRKDEDCNEVGNKDCDEDCNEDCNEETEVSKPKPVPKLVTPPKAAKPIRIELPKETLNYLLVEIVKEVGGLKAKVLGEISGLGNVQSKNVEVVPNSFAASDDANKLLHIQNISVPGIKGTKDGKMKYLMKNAIGTKFVAQFGASDHKCILLDVIRCKIVIKTEDDYLLELTEDETLAYSEDFEKEKEQTMEPETIDE